MSKRVNLKTLNRPSTPKSDVSIVNLSTYTSPRVGEVRGKDWIKYGEDNNYYQYLIDRYNGSPTNNAIINGLSEMIYGKGLDATDSSRKPDQYAQMKSLFKDDCVRKLAYDLKLMGGCAIQVIYSKDRKTIAQVEHLPVEALRAEKANEDGDIEGYYYHKDWSKVKPTDNPQRIPAFGFSKESLEILFIKPYRSGYYYYSPVDYQGGIQYCELEEEISNFHINNIKQGLAPTMLINFNNGVPSEEERQMIETRISQKFAGSSNAGKFILAFNDDANTAATIEPVQLSDAHNQYQFLSDESSKKIMVAHRIVSPMLFGIKDSSGLGNNADEIKTASILLDNTVIRPFQTLLLNAFDKILAFNNIALNLYFKTLQPLEFTDLENAADMATREEETGVKMSSEKLEATDEELLDSLKDLGETEEELTKQGWVMVDERKVDYNQEDALDKMLSLASTPTARPNSKSEQDGEVEDTKFIVRYQYAPLSTSGNSREFCQKMVSAKKLYRKEDLNKDSAANQELGHNKQPYNLFLYKGGVNCHHYWMRKTFKFEGTGRPDVNSPKADDISVNEAKKAGFKPATNEKEVATRPVDMPNNGHHPDYNK